MAALKCPCPQEFTIQSKRMLMLCPGVHRAGGGGGGRGMLGGMGSPKIDWCIINLYLCYWYKRLWKIRFIIQVTLEYKQIAITDNKDQEPIHAPNQITAVLNLVPVCSTPEGKRKNPWFFFEVFLQNFFCFVTWSLSHIMSPAVLAGCHYCFHNLSASFWTVTHSLALRLIQIALSLE